MKQHSEKRFDPEDARLTAFALGELGEQERIEVEALLAEDAEAQAFVAEVRATAEELGAALAEEPAMELSGEQRAAIEAACTASVPRPRARRGWSHPLTRLAAAAVLILTVGSLSWYAFAWFQGKTGAEPPGDAALMAELASPFTYSLDGGAPHSRTPALSEEELRELRDTGYSGGGETLGYTDGSEDSTKIRTARRAGKAYVPLEETEPGERTLYRLEDLIDGEAGYDAWRDTSAGGFGNEAYAPIVENPFRLVRDEPRSTFSIDVDTASYSNVRRFLKQGQLPPPDAVRIEELINYFSYDYPQPTGKTPFSISAETTACPWAPRHRLVQIGLQGRELDDESRPPTNLVFLIDVSGSMKSAGKLELVKQGLAMLIENLDVRDSVAICVYAGSSGLVQPPTNARHKAALLESIDRLEAGGSTNGGEGIQLAYALARQQFDSEAVNRVILATDGDFNVGVTNRGALIELIETEAKSGVFLTVLGFGMGNLKDATLEQLADKGNGHYAYIDGLDEARKVMVEEMVATLVTIAKDVKIQIEFNPLEVGAWRLIGYENRILAHKDFDDDTKDAGEIGAGHTVTALYEVVPLAALGESGLVEELRYQRPVDEPETLEPTHEAQSGELLFARLRYKQPDEDTSSLIEATLVDSQNNWWEASDDLQHAAAVAAFGLVLRGSRYAGELSWKELLRIAHEGRGEDYDGRRAEFIDLVKRARNLSQE